MTKLAGGSSYAPAFGVMQKTASPRDVQAALQRLVAYVSGENPSRERLAAELRGLADRLAGDGERTASCDRRAVSGEPDLDAPVSGKASLVLMGGDIFDDINFQLPVGKKPSDVIESYLKKTFGEHKLKFLQARSPRTTKTLDVKSGKYKLTLDDQGVEGTIEIQLSVKKA